MAIKVNGTTVIDNSRNLTNVGGLKTVNGTSLVGSGNISAGASTSYNAVGTYVFANADVAAGITEGSTYAGSNLYAAGIAHSSGNYSNDTNQTNVGMTQDTSATHSGTWRAMGRSNYGPGSSRTRLTLFVRIS